MYQVTQPPLMDLERPARVAITNTEKRLLFRRRRDVHPIADDADLESTKSRLTSRFIAQQQSPPLSPPIYISYNKL